MITIHPVDAAPPANTEMFFYQMPSRVGNPSGFNCLKVPIPQEMTNCWVSVIREPNDPPKTLHFFTPVENKGFIEFGFEWSGESWRLGIGFSN